MLLLDLSIIDCELIVNPRKTRISHVIDTHNQNQSYSTIIGDVISLPPCSGYAHLSIRPPQAAVVSSDNFAQIMQSLQDSRDVVQDPSRTLAINSMYCENCELWEGGEGSSHTHTHTHTRTHTHTHTYIHVHILNTHAHIHASVHARSQI